jgi:hypothetical protein
VDDAVAQVHVVPSELAQFARAQAEGDREHEQRFEPYVRIYLLVEAESDAAQAAGRLSAGPPPLAVALKRVAAKRCGGSPRGIAPALCCTYQLTRRCHMRSQAPRRSDPSVRR